MARKGGPALYELLARSKDAPRGVTPAAGAPSAPAASQPFRNPLGGSTTQSGAIAQSSTLAWLAVVGVAVVVAYLVGVNRGERIGRAASIGEREEERRLLDQSRPIGEGRAIGEQAQTTADGRASSGLAGDGASASENRAQVDGNGISRGQPLQDGPLPPLQQGVDPREAGSNYFVIATVTEPNAIAIAKFCRDKGLDAYVVPSDNRRFSEVIVLPGFPASERSSAAVKGLQDRIRKVGVLYKSAARGNPDFGDMYHKLYKP